MNKLNARKPTMTITRLAAQCLLLLLAVATAFAQQTPSRRSRNFDIRALQSRSAAQVSPESDTARQAQILAVSERLAAARTESGEQLRYSLNTSGRLKLLSATTGTLTRPSAEAPRQIAVGWLNQHRDLFGFTEEGVAAMTVETQTSSLGLRHVSLEPVIDGLPIFRSRIRVAIDSSGRVIQVQGGEGAFPGAVLPFEDKGPQAAIAAALQRLGIESTTPAELLDGTGSGWEKYTNPESDDALPISVRRVAFPLTSGAAVVAYRINAITSNGSWDLIVSADDGRLLYQVDLQTRLGSARVWLHDPAHGAREVVAFPETWLAAGELTSKGNNVDAFLDENGDGMPDRARGEGLNGGRAFDAGQSFDFPSGDGFGDPSEFKANAVAHAFYHANVAHDYFYALGFHEQDGNFQQNNFGLGGKGGDPVVVQVHSSESVGNAFFATLPDGGSGVMTIGTSSQEDGSYRDLSLSGEVVLHEYAHGVTARIVGGSSDVSCLLFGAQGAALSEAWSDYFAASQFGEPIVGLYDGTNPVSGIRRFALDETPWSYFDLGNETLEPHNDGEIFSALLWDIRAVLGPQSTDALVYAALFLTPCEPSFIDVRDALLTADESLNGGANQQALWTAFAARGMGFGAVGADPPIGPVFTRFDSTTDLPEEFGGGNRSPVVTSEPSDFAIVGETEFYKIIAKDPEGDDWTVEMLDGPANAVFDPDLRRVSWRPSFTEGRFVFAVTDTNGNRTVHGFVWLTFSILNLQNSLRIDGPRNSIGVAGLFVDDPTDLLQITARGGSGDPDLTVWPPFFGLIDAFSDGPDETVSVVDPDLGIWFVVVTGTESYNGVRLRVRSVQPTLTELGSTVTGLFDATTAERVFKVEVPESTEVLRVQLQGGSGDADLFVAQGFIPICSSTTDGFCDYDESSEAFGSYEAVEVADPAAGDWFFTIAAVEAYEDLELSVSTSSSPATVAASTEGAAFDPIVAPGGISTLFGSGFTEPGIQATASTVPLETELAGVRVFVNGISAPLYFVSATQINFQLPFETDLELADIVVVRDGQVSLSFEAVVEQDVPRIFTFTLNEQVEPVVTHASGSIVTPDDAAESGETLIAYLTGLGDLIDPPETGEAAGANPLSRTAITPTVLINGIEVTADFSGLTPGLVGLVQVNFRMPAGLPSGTRVTFEIRYGSVSTQVLTIAVK